MVLGTTYYHAARSAIGTGWNRPAFLPALRNACLALLALTASVVAGNAGSPTAEKAVPEHLPLPEKVESPLSLPTETPQKTEKPTPEGKKKTSVLLPPIPDSDAISSTAKSLSSSSSSSDPRASSSLLEPPPSLKRRNHSEADTNLEVIIGQPRVLTFPDVPHRVALIVNENDPIATLKEVPHRPREWYLIGKKPGTTFLDVWLPDPTNATSHRVLHYHVRILADGAREEQKTIVGKPAGMNPPRLPAAEKTSLPKVQAAKPQREMLQTEKPRIETTPQAPIYQTLEEEINKTFPGCRVHLRQSGELLVVSGTARNLFDASRILNLARRHAPGARPGEAERTPPSSPSLQAMIDSYAHAGGPHVVNLLRIPGEQQIMLRVIVAEVNRSAARSLGLDFGIADKQATVLPSRPASSPGSSTVARNGWIGEIIKSLQDLHYAQILAEPALTTLNGQAACFRAGGEFPIPVVSPSSHGAVQGVAFRSYGVHLNIQPVLADVDRIRLVVDANVSGTDASAAMRVGGGAVPGLKVRNFQSTVELREGETLAVAGLVRGTAGSLLPQNVQPGVVNPASSDQELVVLISPLLLHSPSHEDEGAGQRLNPQDIELYLRSRNTIVPRGDALYLIGPQGYAGKPKR